MLLGVAEKSHSFVKVFCTRLSTTYGNVSACYLASFKSLLFDIYFNVHVFPLLIIKVLILETIDE